MTLQEDAPAASGEEGFALFLEEFRARLGGAPGERCFFSPGRVNLMGAHLDYNGGPVLPSAIDRGTFLAARPRADRRLRLASTLEERAIELELDDLPETPAGTWSDYPLGVVRALLRVDSSRAQDGLDLFCGGNLPIGAGLSSSASVCVGTARALDAVWGLGLGALDLVEAALWAEREFVGVRCGIMDPYAVGLARPGHALWVDCKDRSTEHLPLDADRVCIAVADTGVRRELAQGDFNRRVGECRAAFEFLGPHVPGATCLRDVPLACLEEHAGALQVDRGADVLRRARHVLEEVERTLRAREALLAGDLAGFGEQMFAAHESLRTLFEVSVPELDCLVDAARDQPGVYGARLTGAGFGGCTVTLLSPEAAGDFARALTDAYRARFGRAPTVEFYRGGGGPYEVG